MAPFKKAVSFTVFKTIFLPAGILPASGPDWE
jgi:hypothetical protein